MKRWFQPWRSLMMLVGVLLFCTSCATGPKLEANFWRPLQLETEATFADVAFTQDGLHGWLVGTRGTIFQTEDGGDSWQAYPLDLGEEKISFNAVSFSGQEGWITGEPSILLHTQDGGTHWDRIPLSSKLPGAPYGIVALGKAKAEMVTNLGAIYKTQDGGKSWQALVEGAVGVARTIRRSEDGRYIAVSARGNFYSTWTPGDTEWTPHQRTSSRRLQTMGFTADGREWLLARGGLMQFSEVEDESLWGDPIYPSKRNSWGLLDLANQSAQTLWAAGGSGALFRSEDGGQTWRKDQAVENIPSNFYKIVFVRPEQGFILGQKGVLLKYKPTAEAAA